MNRKMAISAIVLVMVLVLIFVFAFMSRPAFLTELFVDPKSSEGTIGQDFIISINVSQVIDLYGWQSKLKWNATILEVVNVTEGSFLRNGGSTYFVPITNNTVGFLLIDCTLYEALTGINGSGRLATIQFHVKQSGHCRLDLYDTMLLNSAEQTIMHSITGGSFSTTPKY